MAVKKPLCNYGGKLKELAAGDTLPASSSALSIVTTDPVSPANGDQWLLQNFAGGVAMGTLGTTYSGYYQLSVKTADGIKRTQLT